MHARSTCLSYESYDYFFRRKCLREKIHSHAISIIKIMPNCLVRMETLCSHAPPPPWRQNSKVRLKEKTCAPSMIAFATRRCLRNRVLRAHFLLIVFCLLALTICLFVIFAFSQRGMPKHKDRRRSPSSKRSRNGKTSYKQHFRSYSSDRSITASTATKRNSTWCRFSQQEAVIEGRFCSRLSFSGQVLTIFTYNSYILPRTVSKYSHHNL